MEANGLSVTDRFEKAAFILGALQGVGYITDEGISFEVYEYKDGKAALLRQPLIDDSAPFAVNRNMKLYLTGGPLAEFERLRDLLMSLS